MDESHSRCTFMGHDVILKFPYPCVEFLISFSSFGRPAASTVSCKPTSMGAITDVDLPFQKLILSGAAIRFYASVHGRCLRELMVLCGSGSG